MISAQEVFWIVGAPAVSVLVAMVFARITKRRSTAWAAVGLGLGYIAAQVGVFGWPSFQPRPVEHGLIWIALAGVIVGVSESRWRGAWWQRVLWRAGAAAGGAWLIVRLQHINGAWGAATAAQWTAAIAALVVVFWTLIDHVALRTEKQGRGGGGALVMSVIAGLSAALIVLDGQTLVVGQFAGALAIGILACAVVCWWSASLTVARGGTAVVGLLLPLIWVDAWMWAELSGWYVVALALAPALALVGDVGRVRRSRGWIRTMVRVGAVALPLLGMVAWEAKQAMDEEAAARELGY